MRSLLIFLPLVLLAAETPVAKKAAAPAKKSASTIAVKNFKEQGSPGAPIVMEVYTDYQCPSCRMFYMDELPQLNKDFIATGKLRLIHRDFPLAMHQFGGQAAKYANAAGMVGRYELVSNQIFKTQPEWSQNGNIDIQVAKVVSPAEMEKIRDIVKNDPHVEDTLKADVAMGNQDHVNGTPTFEITVRNGRRQAITSPIEYPLMKSYLDQILAKSN